MSDASNQSLPLGVKHAETADDAPFMRFFYKVQSEAMDRFGRIFFLDTSEGHDFITDEIDCSELSGWLIKPEDVEEFNAFYGQPQHDALEVRRHQRGGRLGRHPSGRHQARVHFYPG